jgi:hypothetical protein
VRQAAAEQAKRLSQPYSYNKPPIIRVQLIPITKTNKLAEVSADFCG